MLTAPTPTYHDSFNLPFVIEGVKFQNYPSKYSFRKYFNPLRSVLLQSLRLLLCASWQQPFGASGNRSSVGTKPLANGTLHTPLVTLLSLLVYDLVLWTVRLLRRQYGFDVSSKESLIISQSLTCWWLQFFFVLSNCPSLPGSFYGKKNLP